VKRTWLVDSGKQEMSTSAVTKEALRCPTGLWKKLSHPPEQGMDNSGPHGKRQGTALLEFLMKNQNSHPLDISAPNGKRRESSLNFIMENHNSHPLKSRY
jgi:hypothetical protein